VGKKELGLDVSDVVGKRVGSFVGFWVGDVVGEGVGRPVVVDGGPKDLEEGDVGTEGCFCCGRETGGTGLDLVVRTDKGVSGSIQSA